MARELSELRGERLRLETVLDGFPAWVCILDAEYSITFTNIMFRDTFGPTEGRKCYEVLAAQAQRCEQCPLQEVGKGLAAGRFHETTLADGRRYQVYAYPFQDECGAPRVLEMGVDVTASREAAEALERSEVLFRAVVNSSVDAMVAIDAQSRVRIFNPAAERMLGWQAEQMLGQPVDVIMPERFRGDHRSMVASYFATGQPCGAVGRTVSLPALRSDGTELPVELTLSHRFDAEDPIVLAVMRDTTERERALEALRESEARLRAIYEGSSDAIMLLSEDHFIDCNPRTLAMFAVEDRARLVQMRPTDLLPPVQPDGRPSWQVAREHIRTAYEQGHHRFEWIHRRTTGEDFAAEVILSAFELGGRTVLQATVRDISERREAEQRLRRAQKLEAIGQLAAGIAHEINTPAQYVGDNTRFLQESLCGLIELITSYDTLLTQIKSGAPVDPELVQDIETAREIADIEYLCEEIPNAIKQSLEGIDRISTIVRAMKDFSHPGVDERTPIDLNRCVESTITVARNEWKYVAELDAELDRSLPLVPCFPADINQVVLNLIVNAAHAVAEAQEQGAPRPGRIRVSTHRAGDWAEIRVDDSGPGIPEAIRDRIFEPFFTTKAVGKGTGQGLSLAHSTITQKHGGELLFETCMGQGTTFIVRLPLATPSAEGGDAR
ncbi:MAG TPA: PAS domain S-box protein, partial [Armatimonadota bacterium]|nr:PAS domain S-box protein [Armatimonadota bacterium]